MADYAPTLPQGLAAVGMSAVRRRPRPRLPGVRYGTVVRHADERGAFREVWRADAFGPIDPADAGMAPGDAPTFVQANLSDSAPGVLRGLHVHRRQLDYWVVNAGRALVALVDLRPMLRDGAARPLVETRELAAGRLGGHPEWRRPRVPGPGRRSSSCTS